MAWHDVTIERVVQETPLDRTFHLRLETGEPFAATPGQYVVLRDPTEEPARDWYFSLSGMPGEDGQVRITVRGRGEPVRRIYDASPGARWSLQPPAGTFHVEGPPDETVVLLAAGSGVTPFRTFLEARRAAGRTEPVWLLHSARTGDELLFRAEFDAWARDLPHVHYRPTITGEDDAWTARRGRIDADLLRPAIGDPAAVRVYACGPGPFVEHALETAAALGVPEARRLRERW